MARPDVETAYFSAKLWYWMLHGVVYLIFAIYQNRLRDALLHFDIFYVLPLVLLDFGATYFLYTVGKNPGYLKEYNQARGIQEASLSRISEKTNIDEEKILSGRALQVGEDSHSERPLYDPPRINSNGSIDERDSSKRGKEPRSSFSMELVEDENQRGKEREVFHLRKETAERQNMMNTQEGATMEKEEEKKEESRSSENQNALPFGHFSLELDTSKEERRNPKKHFCTICQMEQPFRTKHCELCEECICKFDHHCFWIGGCVGEKNHLKFWLMLLCMALAYTWGFLISWDALNSRKEDTHTSEYGAFFIVSFITFVSGVFAQVLFWYHTYLLMTGQTTWEQVKGKRISYLKPYPKGFRPFHFGVLENLKILLWQKDFFEWEMPDVQMVWKEMPFNWCENQYWSCC